MKRKMYPFGVLFLVLCATLIACSGVNKVGVVRVGR